MAAGLAAIVAVAALSVYLTAPRPGGVLDPRSTQPAGGHALVALLRSHDVAVTVADNIGDVEDNAGADTLVLVAEAWRISDDLMQRLSRVSGDRLLVKPGSHTRRTLAPQVRLGGSFGLTRRPDCELPEAIRAGAAELRATTTYLAADDQPADICYGGALIHYTTGERTVTVLGGDFALTNSGLLSEGNAALVMNLAGGRQRLIWYAPQHFEGSRAGSNTIFDLIPPNVSWLALQLCLVVALTALWRGRRMGPLVADRLPVVVRASETVEGRGRLYRSHRARDRAAEALRTATRQRISPRFGLAATAPPAHVVAAVAQHSGTHPEAVWHTLFGRPPTSDAELLQLARTLDQIERQVIRP